MVQVVGLEATLAAHPFAHDLDAGVLELIVGCCSNAVYKPGAYIFREAEAAQKFYLIRHGLVSLEIHVPQTAPIVVETLEEGRSSAGAGWCRRTAGVTMPAPPNRCA